MRKIETFLISCFGLLSITNILPAMEKPPEKMDPTLIVYENNLAWGKNFLMRLVIQEIDIGYISYRKSDTEDLKWYDGAVDRFIATMYLPEIVYV